MSNPTSPSLKQKVAQMISVQRFGQEVLAGKWHLKPTIERKERCTSARPIKTNEKNKTNEKDKKEI